MFMDTRMGRTWDMLYSNPDLFQFKVNLVYASCLFSCSALENIIIHTSRDLNGWSTSHVFPIHAPINLDFGHVGPMFIKILPNLIYKCILKTWFWLTFP
ncbi:hypothetical protein LguiA_002137 [Lonicera macranthoides]